MSTATRLRTQGWVLLGLGLVWLTVLLWLWIPWDWVPGGHLGAVRATDVFTPKQIARAEEVSWPRRSLGWSSLAVSLAVTCWWGLTSRGRRLALGWTGLASKRWWLQTLLVVGLVTLTVTLVTAPLDHLAYRRALAVGLSTQSVGGWASDQALTWLVTWVYSSVPALVVVGLGRRAPKSWPLWLAGAGVALTGLASFVQPLVIEPLFNDFTSMQAGPLRSDIEALAAREGVRLDDVLVADASRRTTALNAYVSGIGSSRRVVVYDTLIDSAPREEVLVVVAHELGHVKEHDVAIGTTLAALGVLAAVGALTLLLTGRGRAPRMPAGEVAVVPVVLALSAVGSLLASPVQSGASRAIEARADRISLQALGHEQTFIDLHRRLALRSYADPTPPAWSQWWFGSHPTVLQRVAIARALSAQQ